MGLHGLTLQALSDRIRRPLSESESDSLVRQIRVESKRDPTLIAKLLNHRDHRVREWMVDKIVDIRGADSAGLLAASYRRERDSDIRAEALRNIVDLDPSVAASLKPLIRRGLRSSEYFEPTDSMWALLQLGDLEAEPEIRRIAETRNDWQGRVARIVTSGLCGEEETIAQQLQSHDHDATRWLAQAAAILASPRLLGVLEAGVMELPDETCRGICAHWLGWSRRAAQHRTG